MTDGVVVELERVSRRFDKGSRRISVLSELSLRIEPGDQISVIGPSGVGKSTLLTLLGALDRPDSGRVLYDGEDLFSMSEGERADFRNRNIGFVFQFHHLLSEFTALENAMMPLLAAGIPMAAARDRARLLLDRVGLGPRLEHKPGELSGGEQQRVAVARALVNRPALVLADEPTGNLDPATASDVHELLLSLGAEQGASLVVVTHNHDLARRLPRRLALTPGGMENRT